MTNDGEFLPMYSELRFVLRLLVLLSWLCFASYYFLSGLMKVKNIF